MLLVSILLVIYDLVCSLLLKVVCFPSDTPWKKLNLQVVTNWRLLLAWRQGLVSTFSSNASPGADLRSGPVNAASVCLS